MEVAWLYFALILLFGSLAIFLSEKLGFHKHLMLLASGLILGFIAANALFNIPVGIFLAITSVVFIFIVFECTSRVKLLHLDTMWQRSFLFILVSLFLNVSFLSFFSYVLFDFADLAMLMFLSILLTLNSNDFVEGTKSATMKEILGLESLMSTILVSLLLFILLEFRQSGLLMPMEKILGGIALGFVFGLFCFFLFARNRLHKWANPIVVGFGFVCFFIAKIFDVNAFISIVIFGLMFANLHFKNKEKQIKLPFYLKEIFEITVIVSIGVIIYSTPPTFAQVVSGAILFFAYTILRYVAASAVFPSLGQKERLFVSLSASKGLNMAIFVLLFFAYKLTSLDLGLFGVSKIINIAILFMIFSTIVSSITVKYSKLFLS
jgi:NhaP-type Na+/H+ or K+/H+ antiporter